jgi:hypothetical protein
MPDQLHDVMKTTRDAPPVVDNPRLPRMTERPPRPRKIEGAVRLMPDEPKPDRGTQKRMSPFDARRSRPPAARRIVPDQEERRPVAEQPEGYVRLRLRVEDGELTVVGAKAVEGPFVERNKLFGDLAYEVTLAGKRVSAEAVPDVGVMRSFPHPEGTPEQQGHFIAPATSYEINVRVPKAQVSMAALPRLEIALYRIKEEVPSDRVGAAPLGEQLGRELREVARVKGIRPERLAEPVQAELRAALG